MPSPCSYFFWPPRLFPHSSSPPIMHSPARRRSRRKGPLGAGGGMVTGLSCPACHVLSKATQNERKDPGTRADPSGHPGPGWQCGRTRSQARRQGHGSQGETQAGRVPGCQGAGRLPVLSSFPRPRSAETAALGNLCFVSCSRRARPAFLTLDPLRGRLRPAGLSPRLSMSRLPCCSSLLESSLALKCPGWKALSLLAHTSPPLSFYSLCSQGWVAGLLGK